MKSAASVWREGRLVAARNGRLRAAYGAGTAATIAHIASIAFGDDSLRMWRTGRIANIVVRNWMISVVVAWSIADYGWMVPVG